MKFIQLTNQYYQRHATALAFAGYYSLIDIERDSFAEFSNKTRDMMSSSARRDVFRAAKKHVKHLKHYRSKILARHNPQFKNAIGLAGAIMRGENRDYEDFFEQRADMYVPANSVASMFSPAGYLTELYREGSLLHGSTSLRHLNTRRPDLKDMLLSQKNLDEPVSTLALSNEIFLNSLDMTEHSPDLRTKFYPFSLPYHSSFHAIKNSLSEHDCNITHLAKLPTPLQETAEFTNLCSAFENNVSPTLYNEIVAPIPSDDSALQNMFLRHYGNVTVGDLTNTKVLSERIGIRQDELREYLKLSLFNPSYAADEIGELSLTTKQLIQLSCLVRYSQNTGLSPLAVGRLVTLSQDETIAINSLTLQLSADVLAFQKRYGVSEDDAMVLVGAYINVDSGQFGNLFYNPSLLDGEFLTDAQETINFDPAHTADKKLRATLKRALKVDDDGLLILAKLCSPEIEWVRSLGNISTLYRVGLWANLHALTPQELRVILSANNLTEPQFGQSSLSFCHHLHCVDTTCEWLEEQQLSVMHLYAMLSQNYSATLTPEMISLLRTLYQATDSDAGIHGARGHAIDGNAAQQWAIFAPHIAATFGLKDVKQGQLLQMWIDDIAAEQGLALTSMHAFWEELVKYCDNNDTTTADTAKLAHFCQLLGQLAVIVKTWQLSTAELMLVITKPAALEPSLDKLSLTLNVLQGLAHLKALRQLVGDHTTELLTLLQNSTVLTSHLAKWLVQSVDDIETACQASGERVLNNVRAIMAIYQWLTTAQHLNTSVRSINNVLTLRTTSLSEEWDNAGKDLLASLVDTSSTLVNQQHHEILSKALCAYWLTTSFAQQLQTAGIKLHTRDDVFNYLLIDNQTSAFVTTTRLAEAIASVQLYIHRCLQGMEADVDQNQLLAAFFEQWGHYNKRYSTWAGVSQLAFYPENYVDPELRYNQTNLQRRLFSEISQSQLSQDSVETSFFNYLTGFEDVANLKVLSSYHHGATLDTGHRYFIGRTNDAPYRYFWRSLDTEASDGSGSYVASAWQDWEEINAPVKPVRDNLVRSVVYNARLYIAWVELRSRPRTNEGGEVSGTIDEYLLQLSYRKINGSWSAAMSFPLNMKADAPYDSFNLYLSYHPLQNSILVMLYNPESNYQDQSLGWYTGGMISSNMHFDALEDDIQVNQTFDLFSHMLNTPAAPNKVVRYINSVNYESSVTEGSANDTSDPAWLTITDVAIVNDEVDNLVVPPSLSYTTQATITTHDNSSLPSTINTPGAHNDQSGDSFNANCTITSVINGNVCTHTAAFSVQTFGIDSGVTGNLTGTDTSEYSFRNLLLECQTEDSLYVQVDFILDQKWFDILTNAGAQTVILYDAHPDVPDREEQAQFPFTVDETRVSHFSFSIPFDAETDDEFTFYLSIRFTNGQTINFLIYFTIFDIVVNLGARALIANFGGSHHSIPPGAAGDYSFNLVYTQSIDKPAGLSETVQILVAEQDDSNKKWGRSDTLGYSAYAPSRLFVYNWGSGDIPLPLSGTTPINIDFSRSIPPAGLTENIRLQVKQDGAEVFSQVLTITVSPLSDIEVNPTDYVEIVEGDQQVQYLQQTTHPKRIRLNTLFANELINRAQRGLDNVLSWETQFLQEPQLGEGVYLELIFAPYSLDKYESPFITIKISDSNWGGAFKGLPVYSGRIEDEETRVVLFIPDTMWIPGGANTFEYAVVFHLDGVLPAADKPSLSFIRTDGVWTSNESGYGDTVGYAFKTDTTSEPMDFSGANGLYFWELFYYAPMLVTKKLLSTQRIDDAEHWLRYVFSPQGYVEGQSPNLYHVDRQWNVRPLAEDTAWDEWQVDHTDPDVVAQADPMHYKVATFMQLLDLYIAHGDRAYRLLERDTLAEARMWYVQALNLLGAEPDIPLLGDWANPTLAEAAADTGNADSLRTLAAFCGINHNQADQVASTRSANSLTEVFYPSENPTFKRYWTTLQQRLFNLRHHLSIDGRPLNLPLYATPADPAALQHAAAANGAGEMENMPDVTISIQRFPLMLERARGLASLLAQFGATLMSILERKDGEALNMLLQTQAQTLWQHSLQQQDKTLEQLDAERQTLLAGQAGARARYDSYQQLLQEGVSQAERQSITDRTDSGALMTSANALRTAGAALDMAPNVFGLATGGSNWGALTTALAFALDTEAISKTHAAEARATSEQYRRRAQEWSIQQDIAEHEIEHYEKQLASLDIQLEAARLQKAYVETQQAHTLAQLDFLTTKFSNEALYSWMQGRLSAVFYQFYDLAVAYSLKAELGYRWETKDARRFIQPGAWEGNHAGLLCGESLQLNLAQMEAAYLEQESRSLEVNRTLSLAQAMSASLVDSSFNARVNEVLAGGGPVGEGCSLALNGEGEFVATIALSSLGLRQDYPDKYGAVRRLKQVSVSLPALLGPYEDIQAVLAYSGSDVGIHQSCYQMAISHGLNDSGLFQMDFNDTRYLPFEGLPLDEGSLTLSFPNVGEAGKQRAILESLNDIIVHIRYTIRD